MTTETTTAEMPTNVAKAATKIHTPWTAAEIAKLLKMRNEEKLSTKEISGRLHGRTVDSIQTKLKMLKKKSAKALLTAKAGQVKPTAKHKTNQTTKKAVENYFKEKKTKRREVNIWEII